MPFGILNGRPLVDTETPFMRGCHDVLRVAWPEVAVEDGGGMWETTESKRVAYESLTFPRSVMQFPPSSPGQGPMTAVTREQPVIFYYFQKTSGGASEEYRVKLKMLRDVLLQQGGLVDVETGLVFQVLPHRFRAYCYDSDEANVILMIRNNAAQGAGLEAVFLVGDDAS